MRMKGPLDIALCEVDEGVNWQSCGSLVDAIYHDVDYANPRQGQKFNASPGERFGACIFVGQGWDFCVSVTRSTTG